MKTRFLLAAALLLGTAHADNVDTVPDGYTAQSHTYHNGLHWHSAMRDEGYVEAAAIAPVAALSGGQIIDGHSVFPGEKVLLVAQGGAPGVPHVDNGVWVVQLGAWERPSHHSAVGAPESSGLRVWVEDGTECEHTMWEMTGPDAAGTGVLVDSHAQEWRKVPGYTALQSVATTAPITGDGTAGNPVTLQNGTLLGGTLCWTGTAWVESSSISGDAGQILTTGTLGKAFLSLSADAGNGVTVGSDGGVYVAPAAAGATSSITGPVGSIYTHDPGDGSGTQTIDTTAASNLFVPSSNTPLTSTNSEDAINELADKERHWSANGSQEYNSDSNLLTDNIAQDGTVTTNNANVLSTAWSLTADPVGTGGIQTSGIVKAGFPVDTTQTSTSAISASIGQFYGNVMIERALFPKLHFWNQAAPANERHAYFNLGHTGQFGGTPNRAYAALTFRTDAGGDQGHGYGQDSSANWSVDASLHGTSTSNLNGAIGTVTWITRIQSGGGSTNAALPTTPINTSGMDSVSSVNIAGELWVQDNAGNNVQQTPHDALAAAAIGLSSANFAGKTVNSWTLIAEYPTNDGRIAYVNVTTGEWSLYAVADIENAGYSALESYQLTSHIIAPENVAVNGTAKAGKDPVTPIRSGQSDDLKLTERYGYALGYPIVADETEQAALVQEDSAKGRRAEHSPVGLTAAERVDSYNSKTAAQNLTAQDLWDEANAPVTFDLASTQGETKDSAIELGGLTPPLTITYSGKGSADGDEYFDIEGADKVDGLGDGETTVSSLSEAGLLKVRYVYGAEGGGDAGESMTLTITGTPLEARPRDFVPMVNIYK